MHKSCTLWLALLAIACSKGGPAAPTPSVNREPTVGVLFQGASACAPGPPRGVTPVTPCTLTVVAQAFDPDDDALTFHWSGCAAGALATAVCTVSQPGQVTASVEVSDGHGHSVTASAHGVGTNGPPVVVRGDFVAQGQVTLEALTLITDPEEGMLCGGGFYACPFLKSVTVSGDCRTNSYAFNCGCIMGGGFLAIYRTASSGTCTVSISVQDSWGLVGTTTFSVPYG